MDLDVLRYCHIAITMFKGNELDIDQCGNIPNKYKVPVWQKLKDDGVATDLGYGYGHLFGKRLLDRYKLNNYYNNQYEKECSKIKSKELETKNKESSIIVAKWTKYGVMTSITISLIGLITNRCT